MGAYGEIGDLIRTRIENLRPKLLDLGRRNPLISTKLTPRTATLVRVVDELPEVMRFNLVNQAAAKRHGVPVSGDALSAPGSYKPFATNATASGNFPATVITPAGDGQPHANQQPYLAMNFCIALSGVFPQRP